MAVSTTTYTAVKTKRSDPNAFATIRDGTGTTVVIEEGHADGVAAVEIERGWKRLISEMILPFELVDLLTRVASAPAAEDILVFMLLAYPTNHVLIREDDVVVTTTKLESLRGTVKRVEDSGDGS